MTVYVALLRGVNVAGTGILAMKELVTLCEELGFAKVRTYIQSGNVVFSASPKVIAGLPAVISKKIAAKFGVEIIMTVRTAAQLKEAISKNPFLKKEAGAVHVMFLADAPHLDHVSALDFNRSPPDEFVFLGQEIYLWLAGGIAGTKLTNNYFDRALNTKSTVRNWRTVTTLLEMMEA